jgi:DNA topoisomerase-3
METSKGWSCSKWKDVGCKFTIWKEDKGLGYFGKKVTASMVKSLLKDGRAQVKGLVNPNTKQKFDKDVVLVHENGYWNIKVDFGNTSTPDNNSSVNKSAQKPPTLTEHICPACKKGRLAHSNADKFQGWGCERWKEGCKFSIPAERCGIKLEPYLQQIVNDGHTDIIEGFISKKGSPFPARLVVKDGKLDMEFPKKN